LHKVSRIAFAARKWIISKGDIWAYEYVIFHPQAIPELYTALDRDTITNFYISFNEYVLTDIAVVSHLRTSQQVCKPPNTGEGANGYAIINKGFQMDKSGRVYGHG
jgi:hypothetical protein